MANRVRDFNVGDLLWNALGNSRVGEKRSRIGRGRG